MAPALRLLGWGTVDEVGVARGRKTLPARCCGSPTDDGGAASRGSARLSRLTNWATSLAAKSFPGKHSVRRDKVLAFVLRMLLGVNGGIRIRNLMRSAK